MSTTPKILYKYVDPVRLDVLSTGLIRYSPLGAFNDPFEGRPSVSALATTNELRKILLGTPLSSASRESYDALPDDVKNLLPYETFLELCRASAQLKMPQLIQLVEELTAQVLQKLHQTIDQVIGVLSLSEVPDNLLMWSHYARSHTGFVIGFDSRHPYFNEKITPDDECNHARRIEYRDSRPRGVLTSFEGIELFLIKSGHWQYEREWRVLRPLSRAQTKIDAHPHPIHLFNFPRESIAEIIFGARCAESTVMAIKQACATIPELRQARLKRSKPDELHFLLQIIDETV